MWVYHILFICLSADEYLGCFRFEAIYNAVRASLLAKQ